MANEKFSQFSIGNNLIVSDIVVGLRSGVNTKFTFPGTGINDASNNPMLAWSSPGASAVNYLAFSSANTGLNPSITSTGTDSDVAFTLATKGNGNINIAPAGTGLVTVRSSARFSNGSAIQTGSTNGDALLFQAFDSLGSVYLTLATLTAGNPPTLIINATSLTLTNPLPVTSGGTGTGTAFTKGSVVFAGTSGVYTQDNANLFWDDTNNRLGIGTAVPGTPLEVDGTATALAVQTAALLDITGDTILELSHNSTPVNHFKMTNTATLNSPIFQSVGGDTNIGLIFATKGTGAFNLQAGSTTPFAIVSGTSLQHSASFVFNSSSSSQTITFPDGNGTLAYTSGASGIVNSGTANQLAYYATSGTTVSGLATVNNGVVSTNSSGVPSVSTTLPSDLLVPSPHIGIILDTNSNGMFKLTPIGSAVNYFEFTNAATLNNPIIGVTGPDTNIGLKLLTKGTGSFTLQAASTTPFSIISGTSAQHTASFVFNSSSSSQTITFPDGSGTVSFVGDADFSWSTVAGTSQACAVDNGYVSGNASLTTFTLPAIAAVGQAIAVEGLGAGGWIMTANTGQTIKIGTSTTSSAGSLASTAASDNVYITCIVANTTWRVRSTNSNGLTPS